MARRSAGRQTRVTLRDISTFCNASSGKGRRTARRGRKNVAASRDGILLESLEQRLLPAGDIGGSIWQDTSGDGMRQAGEDGLAGAVAELFSTGPDGLVGSVIDTTGLGDDVSLGTAVTHADGNYSFAFAN